MRDPNNPCLFCNVNKVDMLMKMSWHMLVMTLIQFQNIIVYYTKKTHKDYFDLSKNELIAWKLIKIVKNEILIPLVKGFNIRNKYRKSIWSINFSLSFS